MNFPGDFVCTDVALLLMHTICNEDQKHSAAQTAPNMFFLWIIHTLGFRGMIIKYLFVPQYGCLGKWVSMTR